ncbi:hypothetical protein O9G_000291 [Rozella allomycis CSF55]|uniref:Uncharacterized protein n=1 Tax=Rozella allomycis (strain CSF55) TaxID=988480 RepID=A0A075ATF0_ROZAC|nr:hypothetical protein O9G_000291 [Rozella allomycis CSF55]|eukprot:EPZ31812.1 hypothetical protein O9G_000291 [Rozella allomycis CSF55]
MQTVNYQSEETGSTEINFKIQSVRDRINAAKDELKTLFEVADKFQVQIEEAKREVQELEKKKDKINKETAVLQQESNEWEKKRENLDQEWQKLMNEKVQLDELLK